MSNTNNAQQAIGKLIFKVILFALIVLTGLLDLYLTSVVKELPDSNNAKIVFIDRWNVIDKDGESFDTGRLYNNSRAYTETFTTISKLPNHIWHDSMLCFKNRSDVQVYINGELRRDFNIKRDTGIPGGILKEFYITIPLTPSDGGAEVKIIRGPTEWNPEVVPETFVATTIGLYNYLAEKYGVQFVLTIMLFIAAILVTIFGFLIRIWKRQTMDMIFASLGILDVAFWSISVSQIAPFFTNQFFVDGFMGFVFSMMMPFSFLIYINSIQNGRYRVCHTTLFILSLVSMALWTTLQFSGIRSFQRSLGFIDAELGIVVVAVLVTLFLDIKKGYISEYPYTAIGFVCFMIMSIVEIIMLVFVQQLANEVPMLIGQLCLLVLVVIQQVDDFKNVREHLEAEVSSRTIENDQMLIHIVRTLAGTIDAKDKYTKGHSSRVADYSREIARRFGYDENRMNDVYMMGLLHDIGKIGIPDSVINKPGKLTKEEYEVIKNHPTMGANILHNIAEKKDLEYGARWHHEKFDGTGYPDGIKGEEIPEAVRIIAVADAYDAMTSYRSYRDPMEQERVKKEIEDGSGTQFDPQFAKIMLDMIAEDKNYDLREKKE